MPTTDRGPPATCRAAVLHAAKDLRIVSPSPPPSPTALTPSGTHSPPSAPPHRAPNRNPLHHPLRLRPTLLHTLPQRRHHCYLPSLPRARVLRHRNRSRHLSNRLFPRRPGGARSRHPLCLLPSLSRRPLQHLSHSPFPRQRKKCPTLLGHAAVAHKPPGSVVSSVFLSMVRATMLNGVDYQTRFRLRPRRCWSRFRLRYMPRGGHSATPRCFRGQGCS